MTRRHLGLAALVLLSACGGARHEAIEASTAITASTVPISGDGSLRLADAPGRTVDVPLRRPPDKGGATGEVQECTLTTTVPQTVLFKKDEFIVSTAGDGFLRDYSLETLELNDKKTLVAIDVEGYASTDSRGAQAYDLLLSQKRAEHTAAALDRHILSPVQRITPTGKGQAVPVADNSTEAGRTKNRRVVIKFQFTGCG